MVYGCDSAWWQHRRGLPDFPGLKFCFSGNNLPGFPDIQRVDIARDSARRYIDRVITQRGTVGSGGNSGFQALNLAVQFGARRILLIGYDMSERSGVHWYGRNTWLNANNPDDNNFRRWIPAFDEAAPVLMKMGVEVVNASPNSALTCFPRRSIADQLRAWS